MYTIILANHDDVSQLNSNDIEHYNKISKAIENKENIYLVNGETTKIETESELVSKLYKHNVVSNMMIIFNSLTIILFSFIIYTQINELINIDNIAIFSASSILKLLTTTISFFLVVSSILDIKDAINTKKQISKHNEYIKQCK